MTAAASTKSNSATAPARRWRQKLAGPLRWLHIYTSMFGLVAILFFSMTGFSLNHPDWVFEGAHSEQNASGKLPLEWLRGPDVARLEIVEYLRRENHVRFALDEFRIEDTDCTLAFRGPAYAADVTIDRATGTYQLTQVSEGVLAFMNDLHCGRHTGPLWSWVIDITAITLAIVSLTGLALLLYIKRRRNTGLILSLVGMGMAVIIVWLSR